MFAMRGFLLAPGLQLLRLAAAGLLFLSLPVFGSDAQGVLSSPGWRPASPHAPAFLDAVDTATIAVYPSIIRRATRTANSYLSQEQIIAFLNERSIATAVAATSRIDLGALEYQSQQAIFFSDMRRISEAVTGQESSAQYHLLLEFLLPVSDQEIFGIECYVLDQQGRNAFSFLLNSHHRLFADARLIARDSSEEARAEMLAHATQVGIAAFVAQMEWARGKIAGTAIADYPINELPMYGLREKTAEQKRADEAYIEAMTQDGKSRAEAAESAARMAWNIFYQGDKATAIRRFNQAWLLDPQNQLALWGFAVTCIDRGQLEDAIRYYRMAIEAGPENPGLQRDYDIALRMLAREPS